MAKKIKTVCATALHFGPYFFWTQSELLIFKLLAFNSAAPLLSTLPRASCLSLHSCIRTLFTHTGTHTVTFRNLWPGRQSSFINFWVWVQYSVFLDSHLRAIINAGMLAEHPDLPAQICRHQCEGRAGTSPEQPNSQQPNKRHAERKRTKSKRESTVCARIQILCIARCPKCTSNLCGHFIPQSRLGSLRKQSF